MYFWINFALWCIGELLYGIIISLALEPRWVKIPRWTLASAFLLLNLPTSYIKITHTGVLLGEIMYWVIIAIFLLFLFVPFKDKIWKKILLFVLLTIITYVGDILCTFLKSNTDITFDPSFNSLGMFLIVALDVAIITIFSIVLLIAWNRFINYKKTGRKIWIFFIFPISQLITLYFFNGRDGAEVFYSNFFSCIGILLGFVADFILLYMLMEQGQKEELEKQLRELETLYRVENVHYQSIEARRAEMAKLRHDFNNQLLTAYHLTEQNDRKQSRALLDEIKENIAKTSEYVYCGNPVVNAIINENEAVCQKQTIRLETALELGEEPYIQPVHMCSVFTNLMDNAVHATLDCPEEERFIRVKAARKEDYLHIKVENSYIESRKQNHSERKSYGQEILQDIALRYNGEFRTGRKDGTYCSMLTLTAEKLD